MQEDIQPILAHILARPRSPLFYLWVLIQEKIKKIDDSEELTRLAFIITFSNLKKYPDDLETLALNELYIEKIANLLLTLFECLKYCAKTKKYSYPQVIIYFLNFIELLEKLPWAGKLCEKLTSINAEFLVILLKTEPLNAKLAKAIPDDFLLKKLEDYSSFIINFNNFKENYINFYSKAYRNKFDFIGNYNNFFSLNEGDTKCHQIFTHPLNLVHR